LMFNDETLDAAEKGLERVKSALRPASSKSGTAPAEALSALTAQVEVTRTGFTSAMDDDFNTAGALGTIFDLVRAVNTARDAGAEEGQLKPAQELLRELTAVLGLRLTEKTGSGDADKFVGLLVEVRGEVRKQKIWTLSDLIRDRLKELGVTLEDGKEGTTWRWG
jgi:cysteinyl-tRNA synthetase